MNQKSTNSFPPQAFIFRTLFSRSVEINIVFLLGSLIGLTDVLSLLRMMLVVFLSPVFFTLFTKKKDQVTTFLQNLPYNFLLYLFLPDQIPLILGLLLSAALNGILFFRPRLPALPLIMGITLMGWPALFQQLDTPLSQLFQKVPNETISDVISAAGIQPSQRDKELTDRVNNALALIGANMPVGYFDVLQGTYSAQPVERGFIILLIGFLFLWARGHITWLPVAGFTIVFLPLYLVLGGIGMGKSLFESDALFLLFSGSFSVPLIWNLSDYQLLPLGRLPRFVFGMFSGFICFLGSFINPFASVFGMSLVLWLLQRIFERIVVKEVYHQNDSILLLMRRDFP